MHVGLPTQAILLLQQHLGPAAPCRLCRSKATKGVTAWLSPWFGVVCHISACCKRHSMGGDAQLTSWPVTQTNSARLATFLVQQLQQPESALDVVPAPTQLVRSRDALWRHTAVAGVATCRGCRLPAAAQFHQAMAHPMTTKPILHVLGILHGMNATACD